MTTYGVTPTGFVRPSLQELLQLIERDQFALIDQGVDVSADSPLGQNNGIFARQLSIAWEAAETSHNGFDPDRAEDFLLTALSKLTGTFRGAATKSTVTCTVTLTSGTTLQAGVHFARVAGKPSVRFTPRENFTAPSTGAHAGVIFEAEVPGPVEVGSAQLTVIATAVVGWSAVTNPNPATLGKVQEDDSALRVKREQDLARAGSQTAAAIKADLLALRHEGVQWMQAVEVFQNVDNITSVDGLPPKSFEVVVYDIGEPPDSDDQIAQVIWRNKPVGIEAIGDESGTAIDEKGGSVIVNFSQVDTVPIYITMTLTTVPGFTDFAEVEDTIVREAGALYSSGFGVDVVALRVKSMPLAVPGVIDVPTFTIGTAPSPTGIVNIPIGAHQVATFSTSRITVS